MGITAEDPIMTSYIWLKLFTYMELNNEYFRFTTLKALLKLSMLLNIIIIYKHVYNYIEICYLINSFRGCGRRSLELRTPFVVHDIGHFRSLGSPPCQPL